VTYSRDCGPTGCVVEAIQNYVLYVLQFHLIASG
jgi:hypothetical protein